MLRIDQGGEAHPPKFLKKSLILALTLVVLAAGWWTERYCDAGQKVYMVVACLSVGSS